MDAADLLSKRAYLTPEREALTVVETGERYTYAQLNARASRLANWMRELGVEKGDRVSVLARNSAAYIDLFYGLAKIGAILAPRICRSRLPGQGRPAPPGLSGHRWRLQAQVDSARYPQSLQTDPSDLSLTTRELL